MQINLEKIDIIVDILLFQIFRENLTPEEKKKLLIQKKFELKRQKLKMQKEKELEKIKKGSIIARHPFLNKHRNQIIGLADDIPIVIMGAMKNA